jgi:hypothetical protein
MSITKVHLSTLDTTGASDGDVIKVTDGNVAFSTAGGGVTVYDTIDNLPTTGNSTGDQAFVSGSNRLYIWNGSGWYNIALINTDPSFTTGPESTYALATDQSVTTISLLATDPEGLTVAYSAVPDADFSNLATISQSANVFTITPADESNANTTSGTVTFRASDGINLATSISTFTLRFGTAITATLPGGSPTEEVLPYTSLFNGSVTYNGDGPTTFTTDYSYTARFTLVGAGGGNGNYLPNGSVYGGSGGMVVADVTLSAGTTYYLYVGGGGNFSISNSEGGLGGWPNGGTGTNGDASGGGGGGMTMLSTAPFSTSMSDSDIILIAGGGGGGTGFRDGGHGGGSSGGNGAGGNQIAGGGTQSAGGTLNGGKLQGGDATGLRTSGVDDGGGGGGGYYGGGGGTSDAGGGGGGSGYANPLLTSNVTFYMATTLGGGANGSSYGRGGMHVSGNTERIGGNGVAIIEVSN